MIELRAGMHFACTGSAARRGITPKSPEYRVKGGDNVERIIKLVKAITDLIRAITDLIRIFKA